jgi:hypothetical protein
MAVGVPRNPHKIKLPDAGALASQFQVVVIYESPGFKTDAGGFQIIVTKTPDGTEHLKVVRSPVGPGDPPVGRLLSAAAELLAELDNVAEVSEVQQQVSRLMQQAVLALAQGQT